MYLYLCWAPKLCLLLDTHTGVLVLLAVKLGVLQMPQMPQLPTVPGQGLLTKQFSHAGKALRDKLDHLDDDYQQQEDHRARSSTQPVGLGTSSRSDGAELAPPTAFQTVTVAISAPAPAAPESAQQGNLTAYHPLQRGHLDQV